MTTDNVVRLPLETTGRVFVDAVTAFVERKRKEWADYEAAVVAYLQGRQAAIEGMLGMKEFGPVMDIAEIAAAFQAMMPEMEQTLGGKE
ncbi:MAG: hypothetical protein WAX89_06300 [Alphaproteobacteria bacterium]